MILCGENRDLTSILDIRSAPRPSFAGTLVSSRAFPMKEAGNAYGICALGWGYQGQWITHVSRRLIHAAGSKGHDGCWGAFPGTGTGQTCNKLEV